LSAWDENNWDRMMSEVREIFGERWIRHNRVLAFPPRKGAVYLRDLCGARLFWQILVMAQMSGIARAFGLARDFMAGRVLLHRTLQVLVALAITAFSFSGPAQASFPATLVYSNGCTASPCVLWRGDPAEPWVPSREAACLNHLPLMPWYEYLGVENQSCLVRYIPWGAYYTSVSLEPLTITPSQSYQCPENISELSGQTCTCKPGTDPVGDYCVRHQFKPEEEALTGQSCPRAQPDGTTSGHPIIPATGEKILDETDFAQGGSDGLRLSRNFRSGRVVGALREATAAGLGQTWSHNHSVRLVLEGPLATAGSVVKIVEGDGNANIFTWDTGTNSWKAVGGTDTLDPAALTYTRKSDDSVWRFNGAGQLLTVTQRNGWATTYTYSTGSAPAGVAPVAGRLVSVTSQFGRSLRFGYNAAGQLVSVTLADGRIVSYAYDGTSATARLTTVSYPAATGAGTVSKTYLYENPSFPQLVTGILDENGNRYETLSYDSQGRGTSTQLAGGADLYSIDYSTAGTAVVTDPLGTQRTYNYGTAQGKLAVTGADKPSGTGASSAASRVQDANGFITQETDFLGVNTMYTWDINRRLPLSATKAAGLPEAQTTATQWHPTFKLPTLVTEAGRTTAYTYDTAGNPLTSTVTDTASGVARTTTWTYSTLGLLATEATANGAAVRTYAYYNNSTNFIDPSISADPSFDSVSLLLRGDGPDGLTSFVDSSSASKPVTAGGNARISTAQSRFGGSSLYFDGVRDYISLPADPSLAMKSSDFTIEMWIHKLGNNANASRLWNPDGDLYADANLGIDANGQLVSYGSSTGISWNAWAFGTGIAIPDGVWKHVALVRSGGTVTLYVDGVGTILTTALGTTVLYDGGGTHMIGGQSTGADRAFNGYADDVRITKGVARYTANFTPPTQAFPNTPPVLDPNAVGHTVGDPLSITNAAGHVTQFTLYDGAGRLRQMIDPKGIVIDITYTPRGWVASTTVAPPGGAARTTTYSYDNAGQLAGVTLADGTTLGYSYDAAHRLTGVTDAKGNTVTYTLDAMGNRTGEQVKDPSGILQRNITRVYDALNRVQQTTGASN